MHLCTLFNLFCKSLDETLVIRLLFHILCYLCYLGHLCCLYYLTSKVILFKLLSHEVIKLFVI